VTVAETARRHAFSNGGQHLIGEGQYVPGTVLPDPKTKYGNPSPVYPFAAQIAEVEVDPETGQITVLGFWAAHDVGRVLNLLTLEGQVEGGVATGIGWALMEDMVTSGGKIQNPNFLDYRMPGPLDLPRIDSLFVETDDPNGPFGAKGIGEPALNPVPAAIANAVYNAVGVRLLNLPLRSETVLRALKKDRPDE
ncbi:MAG: molybdopterin-dependent oxidoreductase, partial [Chloroflexi bacterium]|nr:molybdopterin-dependent oxidoreductase [Chloroflexota bacterium]